jgi:hypothetical protein
MINIVIWRGAGNQGGENSSTKITKIQIQIQSINQSIDPVSPFLILPPLSLQP